MNPSLYKPPAEESKMFPHLPLMHTYTHTATFTHTLIHTHSHHTKIWRMAQPSRTGRKYVLLSKGKTPQIENGCFYSSTALLEHIELKALRSLEILVNSFQGEDEIKMSQSRGR